VGGFYIAHPKGVVGHLALMPNALESGNDPEWELVPNEYRGLSSLLRGRDIALVTTSASELYCLRHRSVFKWVLSGWRRVSGPPLSSAFQQHLPSAARSALASLVLSLSQHRTGALLVFAKDATEIARVGSPGVGAKFKEGPLARLGETSTDVLAKLASIDGAMIFDSDGNLRNAGVILQVPARFTGAGEGARSAAAAYGSTFGLAIKISHDGPITVFENGKLVREAA